ncbi:MAG: glycosyltransferase [Clostridiales bacterium]|nr:glycosyltransferase [Clostridiales bacterium]
MGEKKTECENSDPKVSVIIPVYNTEKYLNQCLDSVLSQTLSDIEVICVDDGSTDGSYDILTQRAEQDRRIKIRRQDNAGSGVARNCALSMASGQYVVFMDADDLYPELDTLEQLYQSAVSHEAKIAGGYRMVLKDGNAQDEVNDPVYKASKTIPEGGMISYNQTQTDFNYQCYIYERSFILTNNIFFPDYRRFQDPPFFVRAMCSAQTFYLLPKHTYLYRWGHQNIQWTTKKTTDMLRGNIDVLLLAKEYQLSKLYNVCVNRLAARYKEILFSQISLTETEIYLLLVYANSISDPNCLDTREDDGRSLQLARLLTECEAYLSQLLSTQYQKGTSYFCDFLSNLYSRYLSMAPNQEREIVSSLLCVLSGLFSHRFSYQVRVLLHNCLSNPEFQSVGWLDHPDEWYTTAGVKALQTLTNVNSAFAFADGLIPDPQKNDCTLIHDCVVPDAKFSVIIPVYNVAPYLAECLDSVLGQTMPGIEIVCIDDGSTDDSFSILMDYAMKFSNIKVLRQENAGLSAARNRCMEVATGEYIHFLDSDDWVEPETYQILYQEMKNKNLDMLFFNGKSFYENEQLREKYNWYEKAYSAQEACDFVLSGPDYYTYSALNKTFYVTPCMFALRRQFLTDCHISFPEGILHEDNFFTNVCVLSASQVSHIAQPFYCRRVREGSLTIRPKEFRHGYGYFACFLKLLNFVSHTELDENALGAANIRLGSILSKARRCYLEISDEAQKLYYLALPDTVSMLFYQMIVESIEKQEKLQQTYTEKSELNRKLQRIYAEKSEINRKLQRTYAEKSEINRKLQITYGEKFDRGVQIKELNAQLNASKKTQDDLKRQLSQTRKQMKAAKKQNTAIKRSRSYRLGRILTWPVRKLKGLLRGLRKGKKKN